MARNTSGRIQFALVTSERHHRPVVALGELHDSSDEADARLRSLAQGYENTLPYAIKPIYPNMRYTVSKGRGSGPKKRNRHEALL